jgi:hypothetical protein
MTEIKVSGDHTEPEMLFVNLSQMGKAENSQALEKVFRKVLSKK